MAESEEELKSLLVKVESEKVGLKLNSPLPSLQEHAIRVRNEEET